MRRKIRELLAERKVVPPPPRPDAASDTLETCSDTEGILGVLPDQYFEAKDIAERLDIDSATVRRLMDALIRKYGAKGLRITIGNPVTTRYKRAKPTDRYSETAIRLLVRLLESGQDPRFIRKPTV